MTNVTEQPGAGGPAGTPPRRTRRPRRTIGALVALTSLVGLAPLVAQAQESPREQRREVRERKAEVAGQLDVLQAEQAEVEEALAAVEANVAAERAALGEAERAAAEAQGELDDAEARVAEARGELAEVESQVTRAAIDLFVGSDQPRGMFESSDANELAIRDAYVDMTTTSKLDLIDQLDAARAQLEEVRAEVAEAARIATDRRDEVARRVDELASARAEQEAVVDRVNQRVERRLAEAANLAELDEELSEQIVAAERRIATSTPSLGSGGGGGGGTPVSSGSVPLRRVRGFTVHADIAAQVDAMIGAALAAGHDFGGSAYRDPAAQWRLRRQNCPSARTSPASACSPPTARPGQSMHEQGKALDLTYNGSLIRSRSNPGFRWLAANAGRYGFSNLPSEPWHWSVNGR